MRKIENICCDNCGEMNTVFRSTNPYNNPVDAVRCKLCDAIVVESQFGGSDDSSTRELVGADSFWR